MLLLAYDSFDREVLKVILQQAEEQNGLIAASYLEEFKISNLSHS